MSKLEIVSSCNLSYHIIKIYSNKTLNKYYKRIRSENLDKTTRRKASTKYPMMIIFLWFRQEEIIDNLVDLLIGIMHKIGIRAERKYEKNEFVILGITIEAIYHGHTQTIKDL